MKNLWRIVVETRELRKFYIAVSFFSILVAVASQVQPLLVKGIIDQATGIGGVGSIDMRVVVLLIGGMFLADVSQTIFSNIGGYIGDILQAKLRQSLGNRYFKHLLSLPQRYFDTELTGKILNRLDRSISQISFFVQAMSNNFLQFIFSTVFSLIIVFRYSWQVGLMLLVLYPIFIYLTTRTSKRWREYQTQSNNEVDMATGRFNEAVGQMKVVKSFGRESEELGVFDNHLGKSVEITHPQSRMWHTQDVIRRMVLNFVFLGVFGYIFWGMADGSMTIGTGVLLLQYAINIRMPIFSISFIIDNAQRAIANSEEYFKVLDEYPEPESESESKLIVTDGEVSFQGVQFGYDESKAVLKDLNFTLKPDTKTALVGESGEGKTTITNLLLGFYEPQKGIITVDGQNIASVSKTSLRASTAVVFQEAALFSGTVRENIAYGKLGATKKEIERVARDSNAHEFIQKLPKGYNTEIGERGLKLSGGQKQRIAIARALLKDSPILILDEATSSLDTKSERLVQEALERLMKGRTTIIIAHRLSTIASVDTIITLKNGTVDEVGTPKKLAKSGGIYDVLLNLQTNYSKENALKLKDYEMED